MAWLTFKTSLVAVPVQHWDHWAIHQLLKTQLTIQLCSWVQYYEFWSRELVPGRHYVAVDPGEALCQDVAAKVGLGRRQLLLC